MNKNKGITLIALVITIIVMLILVGVTINLSLNGGLFGYAKQAVKETENARDQELDLTNGDIVNYYAYGKVHNWTRGTGDDIDKFTCSHCNVTYEIGQEISYKADTVTTPYTLTAKNSGMEDAIKNHNYSKSRWENYSTQVDEEGNQTISQKTNLKWVVLGIDDEDGDGRNESLLITTSEALNNVDDKTCIIFFGIDGCNNAVKELDNICETLYSSATYGKARSITIDDINTCLNCTPVGGTYYNGTEWATTRNLTTKLKDLPTWDKIKANGTYTLDGVEDESVFGEYALNGYEYSCSDTLELTIKGTNEKIATITQPEQELIFLNNSYWLANIGVSASNGPVCCIWIGPQMYYSSNSKVGSSTGILLNFNEKLNESGSYNGLRPVVSLSMDIPS